VPGASDLPRVDAIGTPGTAGALRLMLLGAGELGREVAIEAMRLGVEVIAVDRYAGAPAMQIAHRSHVVDMLDARALHRVVELERPHLVVPELEAIATAELIALEDEGQRVVPTARAARLTMDREGIRRLAAEELGLATSPYRFATTEDEFVAAVDAIGRPCVVKPVMSSSGKGQSVVEVADDPLDAWRYAQEGGRVHGQPVIVEGLVTFDYEITLLTVQHAGGVTFCAPIGHRQEHGDYRESWQPQPMSAVALAEAQRISASVTSALGGWGIFGVELFVSGDDVLFSEVSPRPHDTGLVTLTTQPRSEFALHVQAILGLPVTDDDVALESPAASAVILATSAGVAPRYTGLQQALGVPTAALRIFGKPDCTPGRRMGVAVARGGDVDEARARARQAAQAVHVEVEEDHAR
jgi:phosphoribosylglycinamide formyltransferase 2